MERSFIFCRKADKARAAQPRANKRAPMTIWTKSPRSSERWSARVERIKVGVAITLSLKIPFHITIKVVQLPRVLSQSFATWLNGHKILYNISSLITNQNLQA